MTQEHPIAPPSEDHVLKWSDEWFEAKVKHMTREKHLCMQAARWGADQELEACCSELAYWGVHGYNKLYEVRRPKPPSLKEQALQELERTVTLLMPVTGPNKVERLAIIRRALESLPD